MCKMQLSRTVKGTKNRMKLGRKVVDAEKEEAQQTTVVFAFGFTWKRTGLFHPSCSSASNRFFACLLRLPNQWADLVH